MMTSHDCAIAARVNVTRPCLQLERLVGFVEAHAHGLVCEALWGIGGLGVP